MHLPESAVYSPTDLSDLTVTSHNICESSVLRKTARGRSKIENKGVGLQLF